MTTSPRRGPTWTATLGVMLAAALAGCGDAMTAADRPGTPPTAVRSGSAQTESRRPAAPATPPVDIDGRLQVGAPPAIAWLHGRELHRPDAPVLTLDRAYDQVVLIGDRVLGVRGDDEGRRLLDRYDGAGVATTVGEIVDNVVVNAAGTSAAWSTVGGDLTTMWDDGQVSLNRDLGPVSPVAIRGDGSCYEADGGCLVAFNQGAGEPRAADSHGIVDILAPHATRVDDVTAKAVVAVQTSSTDTGSCSAVYDQMQGEYRWRTCDHSLLRFSPDDHHLLASAPQPDVLAVSSVSVLDAATGKEVVTYRVRRGHIAAQAWEDSRHVLLVTYGDLGWRLVRIDLSGHAEQALADSAATDQTAPPFTLAGNR